MTRTSMQSPKIEGGNNKSSGGPYSTAEAGNNGKDISSVGDEVVIS